jgi:DNA helicase-2/ATP-dependent DNA helicase PcrA
VDDAASAQILAGLNDEQRTAVTSDARVLVIRAGAGSGKTRVLTRRIAYGAVNDLLDPRRVLALTFTRKAAGELNHRLRQLGLRQSAAAGTFHAIALAQLRQKWEERGEKAPTLLDRKVGFVARLVPRVSDRTTPLDLVSEIEWAKARRILPDDYAEAAEANGRKPPMEPERVARVYEDYEAAKAKRNLIDFDDILIMCGRMLQRDRNAAEAFRWSFRHVFVDEFQDVNPLQFALLKVFIGPEPDLCVVGDSRQAIYAWNGADSSYLDNFDEHFPGAKSVALRQNYRSTPEILRCASAVLPTHDALAPTLPSGPAPSISNHTDDRSEAKAIARALRNKHTAKTRWRDMAVLVRTNAQVALLAGALADAQVPVNARSDGKLIERPEVLDAIDQMRRLGLPLSASLDDLAHRLAVPEEDEDTHDDAGVLPQALEGTAEVQPGRIEEGSERRQLLEAFIRLGRDHLAVDPNASVHSFVEALKAGSNEAATSGGDRVDVTTFHQAKGLEWEVVHLAGMERGLSPISHAKTEDAVEEEHRLIYVAVTRAKRDLHLHWAQERRFGDRVSKRSASSMLDPIGAAARGDDPRSARSRSAKNAASVRKGLSARNGGPRFKHDESDPVFQALKKWRLSIARANDVPAFVVFNDKTLHAIASDRPTSKSSLLAVSGIGPAKAEQYGEDVLRLVAEADD